MSANDKILQTVRDYETACALIIDAMEVGIHLIERTSDEDEINDLLSKYQHLRQELQDLRTKTEEALKQLKDK